MKTEKTGSQQVDAQNTEPKQQADIKVVVLRRKSRVKGCLSFTCPVPGC